MSEFGRAEGPVPLKYVHNFHIHAQMYQPYKLPLNAHIRLPGTMSQADVFQPGGLIKS